MPNLIPVSAGLRPSVISMRQLIKSGTAAEARPSLWGPFVPVREDAA
jgi:hypothetical protein